MLKEIKSVVSALTKAAPHLYQLYKKQQQDVKILELQESAFLIRDLVGTANDLLTLVTDYRELDFLSLPVKELNKHYSLVQTKLTIQLQRLQRLGDILMSNPSIDLLDPDIKRELMKAIGSKSRGLINIGAGLFFHQILGSAGKEIESDSDQAIRMVKEKYEFAIAIMNGNKLSLDKQREIIAELKRLQAKYLKVLDQVMDARDKLMLARRGEVLAAQYGLRQ